MTSKTNSGRFVKDDKRINLKGAPKGPRYGLSITDYRKKLSRKGGLLEQALDTLEEALDPDKGIPLKERAKYALELAKAYGTLSSKEDPQDAKREAKKKKAETEENIKPTKKEEVPMFSNRPLQ